LRIAPRAHRWARVSSKNKQSFVLCASFKPPTMATYTRMDGRAMSPLSMSSTPAGAVPTAHGEQGAFGPSSGGFSRQFGLPARCAGRAFRLHVPAAAIWAAAAIAPSPRQLAGSVSVSGSGDRRRRCAAALLSFHCTHPPAVIRRRHLAACPSVPLRCAAGRRLAPHRSLNSLAYCRRHPSITPTKIPNPNQKPKSKPKLKPKPKTKTKTKT